MKFKNKNWFLETAYPDVTIGLEIKEKLYVGTSQFQKIEVFDTCRFGKLLVLDGVVQTTVGDEFVYHEMLVHVPLLTHPHPDTVLVIGGGDGGAVREILHHPAVQKVSLVEIDREVVEVCRKFMPEISQDALNNPKVVTHFTDGVEFIRDQKGVYDVIIIDSSDPVGPSTVLLSEEFHRAVSDALKPGGILVQQSGSTFFLQQTLQELYHTVKQVFRHTAIYLAPVPTYIGGFFSFIYASHTLDHSSARNSSLLEKYGKLTGTTRYYNPEIHQASFRLPNYLLEALKGGKPCRG